MLIINNDDITKMCSIGNDSSFGYQIPAPSAGTLPNSLVNISPYSFPCFNKDNTFYYKKWNHIIITFCNFFPFNIYFPREVLIALSHSFK